MIRHDASLADNSSISASSSASNGVVAPRHQPWRPALAIRFVWTIASIFAIESFIVGLSALPAVAFFEWHAELGIDPRWLRVIVVSMAIIPAYVIFSLSLMFLSAAAMRLLGWRPPNIAELRISQLEPELCDWGRYMISSYVVKTLVGPFTQATLVWSWYMRMNGASIGHRAWVNSLGVTDHCNIQLGDDVVIGAGVHMSAHTVEGGVVRIAPIKIGAGSTIGVNSHIQIGSNIGDRCQIGSMSMVPKFTNLVGPGVWAGVPVRRIERRP